LSEDKSRPYVSSSPSNGLEDEKENWTAKNPGDWHYGDVHFYCYLCDLWKWETYPQPRFASEYGIQSYPSLQTFKEALDTNDFTYPVSKAVDHRQHHGGGTADLEKVSAIHFKLPSHGGVDRFNDLIYLTQINQAMAMKTETEHYRRTRPIDPKTGIGYTMGALYWQINDIWEAPT
jgi:beta-mannosidase